MSRKQWISELTVLFLVVLLWMHILTGAFITPAHEFVAKYGIAFSFVAIYFAGKFPIGGKDGRKDAD